ncbi:MAG TPA: hypothetical protein VFS87_05660 [Qipengyuania sp.]|nr:hypothetical protein [Qipengyuania sp.]
MKQHRILAAACALMFGTGLAVPAVAQSAVALKGDVKVIRQVAENGKTVEKLEDPNQVLPGDRLVFTTRFTNGGTEPATDFVVTNPLPAPVKLAQVDSFEVSVDGGKTFGTLAALKATGADGKPRAAELADVTHVRWRVASIAPGASGEVKYFAEVR